MSNWQAELKRYLAQVDRETYKFLRKIDVALHDSGLEFDMRVRKYFMNCVDRRLDSVLQQIDIDLSLNGQSDYSSDDSVRQINDDKRMNRLSSLEDARTSRTTSNSVNKSKSNQVKRLRKTKVTPKRVQKGNRKGTLKGVRKGIAKGKLKKQGINRYQLRNCKKHHERMRKPPSNQTRGSELSLIDTQVAVVSSSSFSPTKPQTNETNQFPDAALNPMKLITVELEKGSVHKVDASLIRPLNLRFLCFHCPSSAEQSYGCIEDVFEHWLVQHRNDPSETKSFQFLAMENVACHFCDVIDSYQVVLQHQKSNHPNESTVIVAEADRKRCALCPYSGDSLIGHFEIEHELLLQLKDFNPLCLTDDRLNRLLMIDAQKRFCEPCHKFFDTQSSAREHQSVEHAESSVEHPSTDDGEIMYLICPCQTKVNSTEYCAHILGHFCEFECSTCKFQATNLIDLVEHDKVAHQTSTLKFRCMELSDQLMKFYFTTCIVFGNGLVLSMHNVLRTKFDISDRFKNVIDKVLGTNVVDKVVADSKPKANDRNEETNDVKTMHGNSRITMPLMSRNKKQQILSFQNRFSNDLAIQGIPLIEGENLQAIFLAICNKIGAKINADDIAFVRRYSNHKREIVHVSLNKRKKKMHILERRLRHNIKAAAFIDLPPNVESTQIFINPYMTKHFCNLCKQAKQALKDKKLFCYSVDPKGLYVRRTRSSQGTHILSVDDLNKYIQSGKSQKK